MREPTRCNREQHSHLDDASPWASQSSLRLYSRFTGLLSVYRHIPTMKFDVQQGEFKYINHRKIAIYSNFSLK